MADTASILIILLLGAFLPPLLFVGLVRKTERFGREPLGRVLRTFVWGAIFAVIITILLSVVLIYVFQDVACLNPQLACDPRIELLVLAVILAPFVEEFAKGIGVFLARPVLKEPEDGIVYGAASGLGFAASENLLYGVAGLAAGGIQLALLTIAVRSISSALLHASASATFGYGIARNHLWPDRVRVLPFYLTAVGMHAGFNLLASASELYTGALGEWVALVSLFAAIALALIAFSIIRRRIRVEEENRASF